MAEHSVKKLLLVILFLGLIPSASIAVAEESKASVEEEENSTLQEVLLYIPNRIFDLADIFRLRARVGPGFAVGLRATELVNLYAGSYATVFVGLPGPRLKTTVPVPVGLESHNGVSVSLVDATADGGIGPDYSPSEFGLGFQLAIVGIDVSIDPLEMIDFVAGIALIDMQSDDF